MEGSKDDLFFRWVVGELTSGPYIMKYNETLNNFIAPIRKALIYHMNVSFHLDGETGDRFDPKKEMSITDEDLIFLGRFLGYYAPYVVGKTNKGSVRYTLETERNLYNGQYYTERGLYDMNTERFNFYNLGLPFNDSTSPIFDRVNENLRSTVVPPGEEPVGYIVYKEGQTDDIINERGNINLDRVVTLEEAQKFKLYYPVYGKVNPDGNEVKPYYLWTDHYYDGKAKMNLIIYKKLLEILQKIRYNGIGFKWILDAIEVLMTSDEGVSDYMTDVEFSFSDVSPTVTLTYTLNPDSALPMKDNRMFALQQLVSLKFKDLVLVERGGKTNGRKHK